MKEYKSEPSKLELVYDYFNYYQEFYYDKDNMISVKDEWGNRREPKIELYAFVSSLYGYNGFPKILKDNDFEHVKKQLLYHGTDKHEFAANYLWDPVFHMGYGNYGSGMYFSSDFNDARSFVGGMYKDETRIITSKLNTDKVIKHTALDKSQLYLEGTIQIDDVHDLQPDMIERLSTLKVFLDDKAEEDNMGAVGFRFLLADNPSILATLLGAEAVINDNRPEFFSGMHVIVLKRDNLLIPEKCAKTIFKKGGIEYKDLNYIVTPLSELENSESEV